MTADMQAHEWLPFLEREYLDEFIKDGGASVKFAVPHDDGAKRAIVDGVTSSAISGTIRR